MRQRQAVPVQSGATIKPLRVLQPDDTLPDYETTLATIESEKQKLMDANAENSRKMAELAEQEQLAFQAKQAARRQEKVDLRVLADYYRELAAEQTDRSKADELAQWAMDCDRQSRTIIIEGEAEADPVSLASAPPLAWWERHRQAMAVGLAVVTALIILVAGEYFHLFRDLILEQNKSLPLEQQMQPYDWTSIQKLAFEKMVQFSDLPIALVMLLLVMPPVAFYVLPFMNSKPDFWHEFKHELTPFQRCSLATCFILGFLLLAVLAHIVKS